MAKLDALMCLLIAVALMPVVAFGWVVWLASGFYRKRPAEPRISSSSRGGTGKDGA